MYGFSDERGPAFPWRRTALALATFGALAALVALGPLPALEHADVALSGAVRDVPSAALDAIALGATLLGDFPLTTTLMVATTLLVLASGRRALALHAAWTFFLAKLAVAATKLALGRPRPVALYAGGDAYAFPSGHATSAAVLLGVVAALFLARRRTGGRGAVLVTLAFASAASLVALSRVRLGAHWPSDVAAGLALAAALVLPFAHHARRAAPPARLAPLALACCLIGYALYASVAWRDESARYAASSPQTSASRLSLPQAVR